MRRPFGLWLLLTIVAIWLKVQDVYSLRATALIFAKSTTTTTTTIAPQEPSEETSQESVTEASSPETTTGNTTGQLTGIPQIDYIWDPNLPRELNGYNLSEYPFYDGLPKDINFKCDGLHDGFYASVPHKCQVYHHCLYGVRYDFLCANYTAFDQKTFICHFVSEVDCLNSKNFWHRNDALYKAISTTTPKPPPPPPQPTYTFPPQPAATAAPTIPARRPERPRRPYPRRPRPYDYYDEEYDEEEYYEKPVRRQRPRYRPRVYDEEYEYEEEDYVRRPNGRRNENRRPYKPRGSNRRRPYDEEEYEDQADSRRPDVGRRNSDEGGSRRPLKRRPIEDDEYDRRPHDRPRKKGHRRPIDYEYEENPPPRRVSDRRKNKNRDDNRKYEDDEPEEERPRKTHLRDERPRKIYDRKRGEEVVDNDKPRNDRDRSRNEESSGNERPNKNNDRNRNEESDDKPLPKPPTSIYERKRPVLKVRPPVPAHEQPKYSPKIPKSTTPAPADEDYYYDDEEEEEDTKRKEEPRRAYAADSSRKNPSTTQVSAKRDYESRRKVEVQEDKVETATRREKPKRPKYGEDVFGSKDRRNFPNRRIPVPLEEYDDYEENKTEKGKNNSEEPTTTVTTTTTTREPPREPVVKVLKRPFLPSRGGNPYASRGLLPVGAKALDTSDAGKTQETQNLDQEVKSQPSTDDDRPFKQPIVVKVPIRNKYSDEEFQTVPNRPVTRIIKISTTTTTTEAPKIVEKNPLDLDENEYDVTLNDALNPTLPNLPIRNFPTGFSPQNDYTYNTVQRPRYVIDPVVNQASSDYVYRIEQPEANNIRYKSVPVFQSFRASPRVTQAIYSPY